MNRTTKRALTVSALALGLITAATTASAAILAPGEGPLATAGIASTRHNLGTSNRTANGLTTPLGLAREGDLFNNGTDEICVFCHTPHGFNTEVKAPLWNKATPTSTYTPYTSGTMQGTAGTSVAAGSMSLACLSCHDGTQAMDNMINSPGGSGYQATGGRMIDSAGAQIGTWSNTTDTTNGIMQSGAGVVMLGTDLSNDHPIGMAYCGGGAAVGSNANCADPDFAAPSAVGAQGGFAVGGSTTAKNNMRLYGSNVAAATVECASCHDPHNDVNKTFLRISNSGSAVCLTCHVK